MKKEQNNKKNLWLVIAGVIVVLVITVLAFTSDNKKEVPEETEPRYVVDREGNLEIYEHTYVCLRDTSTGEVLDIGASAELIESVSGWENGVEIDEYGDVIEWYQQDDRVELLGIGEGTADIYFKLTNGEEIYYKVTVK